MVISVPGNYYVLKTEEQPSREALKQLFDGLEENDIIEVNNGAGMKYHVTRLFLDHSLSFADLSIPKTEDAFQCASKMPHDMIVPVMDNRGGGVRQHC